jgi:hypothetical protein
MWTCQECGRIFGREKQPHSCKKIPLKQHFLRKEKANELFNYLLRELNEKIGKTQIISLPCCIHLFGTYDFLAALPKSDRLEIRFSLNRKLNTPKLKISVPVSTQMYKNCFDIGSKEEINDELMSWIKESYHLKDIQN